MFSLFSCCTSSCLLFRRTPSQAGKLTSSKRLICVLKQLSALLNPAIRYIELFISICLLPNLPACFLLLKPVCHEWDLISVKHLVFSTFSYQIVQNGIHDSCVLYFLVSQNAQVTEAWNKIAQSFKCSAIEGEQLGNIWKCLCFVLKSSF